MKILLLTAVDPFSYQIIPDLGLMYIAQAARLAGHEVTILDCRREGWGLERLRGEVLARSPRVIGIKSYSNEAGRVREMVGKIRRALPGVALVVGGPHVSMDPAAALEFFEGADCVIAGEAESSFPAWLERLEDRQRWKEVPGIAFRDESGVVGMPPVWENDLDVLPLPAWDLMPPRLYPDEAAGIFVPAFPAAPMALSRGCPFPCAYCGCRRISGSRIRYRSIKSILAEIDLLEKEHGVKTFTFVDDNFTCDRARSKTLFEALAQRKPGVSFTFPNGVRADTLDEELVRLMEKAGCYSLALGIESGSDEVLARMRKKQTVALVREKVEMIRRVSGIRVTGFFILGYPGETESDVRRTIDFAVSLPVHHAHFCLFIPIPGTPVHAELEEAGKLGDSLDYENLTIDKPSVFSNDLNEKSLLRLHQLAYLRFYATPWRALNLFRQLKSPSHLRVILRRFLKLF